MKQKIGLLLVIGLIVLFISNIVVDKIEENKQINSNIKGYEDTGILINFSCSKEKKKNLNK